MQKKKKINLPLPVSLIIVFLSMSFFMTIYEIIKQFFIPSISIWESHIITITFSSILATVIAYFIQTKFRSLLSKLEKDNKIQKALYKELKKSKTRYEAISTLISDYAFGSSVDSEKNLNIDWSSGALTTITGYNEKEIRKRGGWQTIIHNEDLKLFRKELKKLLNGRPISIEYRIHTKNGKTHWVHNFAKPVKNSKKTRVTHIYGAVQNITEQKKIQEELENLNKQKDKFFSILAHDLKNPIISFLSFANLVENSFDKFNKDEKKQLINSFRSSVEMTSNLLNNLLTWARIQNGRMEFKPLSIPVHDLVNNSVKLLKPSADEKNITLINKTGKTNIFADISMTESVIRNLLTNAIKFTESGGSVTVSSIKENNLVKIQISDTGIGIPPEIIRQLFAIGGKIQRSGTSNEKGSGLGLILCKEFIEIHSGSITIDSIPNKGTRVTFSLPVAKET